MTEVLTHKGPVSVTIRLEQGPLGWIYGLDTREANGCGIGSPLSATRVRPTRASAICSVAAWVRDFHGSSISFGLNAWLDSLAETQPDLFGAAA